MKIAVLSAQLSKEEMLQKPVSAKISFVWAESLDEMMDIADAAAYFDLEFVYNDQRVDQLKKLLPKPVFINSVVHTLTKIGQPFIRINAWPGFLKRNICEIAVSDEQKKKSAETILRELTWDYRFAPDVPGMIAPRIIAAIINEAYFTFQDRVSTKAEIDIAMKLGTNYPFGPFEWSEKIGLKNIYELLVESGKADSAYKVSGALKLAIETLT